MDWIEPADTLETAADDDATVPCSICGDPCLDPDLCGVGITIGGEPVCSACADGAELTDQAGAAA